MNNTKTYIAFIGILFIVVAIVCSSPTILPVMDDDEYFVDENGVIHGESCPYRDVPWFTKKHSKYDILIMEDQEICRECLFLEDDKLMMLHDINIEKEISRLKRAGASEEYISDKMKKYK